MKAGKYGRGFMLLLAIGILDTSVRMGLLTFLPFLLQVKAASLPASGLALSLVFIGGAAGKFLCGWLGERLGLLRTVLLTEGGTALGILAVLILPLGPTMIVLPLLGVMLNGTSSVLYGTVPDLAPSGQSEHAFALFYTGRLDLVHSHRSYSAFSATALVRSLPLRQLQSPQPQYVRWHLAWRDISISRPSEVTRSARSRAVYRSNILVS